MRSRTENGAKINGERHVNCGAFARRPLVARRAKANDALERSNVLRPLVIGYDPFDALR